jgi:hypothetical protein
VLPPDAAGVDDELHPPAISTAPIPTTTAATFADLNIVLRSLLVIAGITERCPPTSFGPEAEPHLMELVWIGFR